MFVIFANIVLPRIRETLEIRESQMQFFISKTKLNIHQIDLLNAEIDLIKKDTKEKINTIINLYRKKIDDDRNSQQSAFKKEVQVLTMIVQNDFNLLFNNYKTKIESDLEIISDVLSSKLASANNASYTARRL